MRKWRNFPFDLNDLGAMVAIQRSKSKVKEDSQYFKVYGEDNTRVQEGKE